MAKKKEDIKEVQQVQETPASETLKPASMAADDPSRTSKTAAMADVASIMQGMGPETINKFMDMMKQFGDGQAGDGVPNGAAEKNASTIAAKPSYASAAQEDLAVLFGDSEELTEEFKKNASDLFEAAVSLRVSQESARLEEEFEQKIQEETVKIQEELTDQLDDYLDYVVNEWYEENQVAIDNTVRSEISEKFMSDLRDLFSSYYIDVPEDKVDVVEELTSQIEDLRDKVNTLLDETASLEEELAVTTVEKIFNEISEGLTDTQREKLMGLTENLNYDDFEDFKTKVVNIKENYFDNKKLNESASNELAKSMTLFEETEIEPEEEVRTSVDPVMASYVSAVTKSLK